MSDATVPLKLKPARTHQPTFQLNPRVKFNVEKVEQILRRVVNPELAELEYNDKVIPETCLNLVELIRNAVKEENYGRYRIVVSLSIGQRRQQSVHVYHSFLWDAERDSFATHSFENCHIFASVVVYGVYLD